MSTDTNKAAVFDTFGIERAYAKTPDQVFAAFADPARKRRWFGESPNHEIMSYEMNFGVGGAEVLVYRFTAPPIAGAVLRNETRILDLVANARLVLAQTLDFNDKRVSATLVTLEFKADGDGCVLNCTHQGAYFEGADGPELRKYGWKALFERLATHLS